jgi:predicted ribosome quality control (RQC) complex YloA/Tae2 family protein
MFDAIALAAIADELIQNILHGRVQEIIQLDALTFEFEIYANKERRYLLTTARADEARVHFVSHKLRGSGETPTPFLLLLRKHAENAFIDAVTQLPNERVLKIQFDHSSAGISTLVIETIGRYSNLILLDAGGLILDAAKRVTASMNRARILLPRQKYLPPPSQAKLDPSTLTIEKLSRALNENKGARLYQMLVKTIAGVSPLFAREIEHRVGAHASAETILATLHQLSHAPWQPCVAYEDGEAAAFAPYSLAQYADARACYSISAAIEAFYGVEESYAALKEDLRAQIADARDRLARKRDSLEQSLPKGEEIEKLRTSGELVLGYASLVRAGQKILKAESGESIVEIALDPMLSPVENAQKYFKEYRRAKDARARVPTLIAATAIELAYAEQMLNDLEMAENRAEIDAVARAAREAGLMGSSTKITRTKANVPSAPRTFQSEEGFTILVGKNARQNEEITFRRANAEDLWLHVRNVAGAHVVIIGGGREIPDSTIRRAALLAAQYSQARGESRADVIVTQRKNVRRVRGGKPGMVTVREERIVRVRIEQPITEFTS